MHASILAAAAALTLAGAAPAAAQARGTVTFVPEENLRWTQGGVPQVSSAAVDGDMAKGPCRFFLKYAAGFVTPLHHHTPDHYVATISGTLMVSAGGKEYRVTPGSFFALTGEASHIARCEAGEDCVMFIHALGAWDAVMEPAAAK